MSTATKTAENVEMDAAKAVYKKVVQQAAETAGDLIGNTIAKKFNSAD